MKEAKRGKAAKQTKTFSRTDSAVQRAKAIKRNKENVKRETKQKTGQEAKQILVAKQNI